MYAEHTVHSRQGHWQKNSKNVEKQRCCMQKSCCEKLMQQGSTLTFKSVCQAGNQASALAAEIKKIWLPYLVTFAKT